MKWRIQRVPCRDVAKSVLSAARGGGAGGEPHPVGGGPGALLGIFFKELMQMVHSEPIFCRIRVDTPPNSV